MFDFIHCEAKMGKRERQINGTGKERLNANQYPTIRLISVGGWKFKIQKQYTFLI